LGRKYTKGERVLVTPAELESFQWAIDQEKMKKTGGSQRKKVTVGQDENKQ
jgi:ATP-binding cassette subfamily F protein 3